MVAGRVVSICDCRDDCWCCIAGACILVLWQRICVCCVVWDGMASPAGDWSGVALVGFWDLHGSGLDRADWVL